MKSTSETDLQPMAKIQCKAKPQTFLILLLLSALLAACGSGGKNHSDSAAADRETMAEDKAAAENRGYRIGFSDGQEDGLAGSRHGQSYNDRNSYETEDLQEAYTDGYEEGYEDGYKKGGTKRLAEQEEERNNYKNWDDERLDGFYIDNGITEEDLADYVAREYHTGEYFEQGGVYYIETDPNWHTAKGRITACVSTDLYQVTLESGEQIYIRLVSSESIDHGSQVVLENGGWPKVYHRDD